MLVQRAAGSATLSRLHHMKATARSCSCSLRKTPISQRLIIPCLYHLINYDFQPEQGGQATLIKKPQHALLKQAYGIGHANSKQQPVELNAQHLASVNTNPCIRNLETGRKICLLNRKNAKRLPDY